MGNHLIYWIIDDSAPILLGHLNLSRSIAMTYFGVRTAPIYRIAIYFRTTGNEHRILRREQEDLLEIVQARLYCVSNAVSTRSVWFAEGAISIALLATIRFRPGHQRSSSQPRSPNIRGLASNLRGDLFQADQAGERAHFLLLIFAQLKQ
jgi:hypothetical protein